jgi:hypothetical protein
VPHGGVCLTWRPYSTKSRNKANQLGKEISSEYFSYRFGLVRRYVFNEILIKTILDIVSYAHFGEDCDGLLFSISLDFP